MPKIKAIKAYRRLKVYDCQTMPEEVKKAFFDIYRHVKYDYKPNDCAIQWWAEVDEGNLGENSIIVNNWLFKNGTKEDETVIILHWW